MCALHTELYSHGRVKNINRKCEENESMRRFIKGKTEKHSRKERTRN